MDAFSAMNCTLCVICLWYIASNFCNILQSVLAFCPDYYVFYTDGCLYVTRKCPVNHRYEVSLNRHITVSHITDSWHLSGPVFCLLLDVSSDYAQPIIGQVTKVTYPVIGRAHPEFTPSKGQKTGPGGRLNIKSSYQYRNPHVKGKTVLRPSYVWHGNPHTWEKTVFILRRGPGSLYCYAAEK